MEQRGKKNRTIAGLITLLFHGGLVLISIYTVIWSAPEELAYGIEINFGSTESGQGKVKPPTQPAKTSKSKPASQSPSEPPKTTPPVQNVQTTPPQTTVPQPQAPEIEQPVEQIAEPPSSKSQPEVQPEPSSAPAKVILPTPPDLGSPNSQGNTQIENGDQGSEEGRLNTDALLTDPKNIPTGAQLDMPGWGWKEPPEKVDQSQEQGKIIFEIAIDENGEIIAVKTKFRSVSKVVANFYQAQVNSLIFIPNNPDISQEGITKGYITFIIQSK